jgi:hypothetical protein
VVLYRGCCLGAVDVVVDILVKIGEESAAIRLELRPKAATTTAVPCCDQLHHARLSLPPPSPLVSYLYTLAAIITKSLLDKQPRVG